MKPCWRRPNFTGSLVFSVDKATPYRIESLTKKHNRQEFECGEPELNKYFREQARQDTIKKLAATFVLIDNATDEIVGFYSLSSSAIDATEFPPEFRLSKHPIYPVILLGKLASSIRHRDKDGKKQGLGRLLLMDALFRAYEQTNQIGAIAVILDAKHNSITFYTKYGFLPTLDTPNRFFIPMKSIKILVEKSETY